MKSELEQKQLRAMQYWYVDGTYEFNIGGICLALGLYFLALSKFEGSKFSDFLNVIMVLVFIGAIFLVSWLVRQLKTNPLTTFIIAIPSQHHFGSFSLTRGYYFPSLF